MTADTLRLLALALLVCLVGAIDKMGWAIS